MAGRIRELWRFREMILSWTRKELRTRYKGSFLGFLWTFVNPLMQLAVYSLIFPYIMRFSQDNYAMFLFVALVPWTFFTSSVQGGCGLIVGNSSLVTKVYFPREILPISYALSGLMNMVFSYAIVFPMLLLFQVRLTWNVLWLPALMLLQTAMCAGFAMLTSSVNVYFRDLEHMIGVVMTALYFMTPIMYDIGFFPEELQKFLYINPITGFVVAYRDITYGGTPPDLSVMGYQAAYSLAVFAAGYAVFGKLQRRFAEIL